MTPPAIDGGVYFYRVGGSTTSIYIGIESENIVQVFAVFVKWLIIGNTLYTIKKYNNLNLFAFILKEGDFWWGLRKKWGLVFFGGKKERKIAFLRQFLCLRSWVPLHVIIDAPSHRRGRLFLQGGGLKYKYIYSDWKWKFCHIFLLRMK